MSSSLPSNSRSSFPPTPSAPLPYRQFLGRPSREQVGSTSGCHQLAWAAQSPSSQAGHYLREGSVTVKRLSIQALRSIAATEGGTVCSRPVVSFQCIWPHGFCPCHPLSATILNSKVQGSSSASRPGSLCCVIILGVLVPPRERGKRGEGEKEDKGLSTVP